MSVVIKFISDTIEALKLLDFRGVGPLHFAAFTGHRLVVWLLLQAGCDVGAKSGNGFTPLHWAASAGHGGAVQLLLDGGSDVEATNEKGVTPLYEAASVGHEAAVRLLLAAGCNLGVKDKKGWTPLHQATLGDHKAAVRLLLAAGSDVGAKGEKGWTALHIAAAMGRESSVRLLLAAGSDVDAKEKDGETPLHLAVRNNHLQVMRLLKDAEADLNAKNVYGWTPLHVAVIYSEESAVLLLLEACIDVRAKNEEGLTLLHYAAAKGQETSVRLLLTAGSDVKSKDGQGLTPLHWASMAGQEAAVQLLLAAGSGLQAKDQNGSTPLHHAAREGHLEVMELLRDAGAQVDARSDHGLTPLHNAAQYGQDKVVRLLTDTGTRLNVQDNLGGTPLHWAAMNGNEAAIRLLLAAGCDVDIKTKIERTPLSIAASEGHTEIMRLLIDAGAKVDSESEGEWTPLHSAARTGHLEAMRLLTDAGAMVNPRSDCVRTPLHVAVMNGHVEAVRWLADAGAELNAKDEYGRTPLHHAALAGQLEILRELADAGAEANTKDVYGWSPLATVSALGLWDVVNILLSQGRADPNLASDKGWTPLDCAAHYNHFGVVQMLASATSTKASLGFRPPEEGSRIPRGTETVDGISMMLESVARIAKRKAALHPEEKYHLSSAALTGKLVLIANIHETPKASCIITPLHYAALCGHDSVIRSLIAAGENVRALTRNGASVLHFASLSGRLSTVQMVARQVDPGLVDAQGITAAQYAQARGHHHIACWLSKGHSKPDYSLSLSLNALHNLMEENREQMFLLPSNVEASEALLNCGIWDLHYQDERGRTPLHVAAINNRIDEVKYLLERGALLSPRTHDFKTPSDFAALLGHRRMASFLSDFNSTQKMAQAGPEKCRLFEKLLRLIIKTSQEGSGDQPRRCLDAVRQCTYLLESGAPLDPLCCQDAHALHLAITCNCTPLLPLLLSTGVPLTASADSIGPVELAGRSENVTPWVSVLVTRAIEQKLRIEMEFEAVSIYDKILKKMIGDLIEELRGEKPWRAKCPDFLIPQAVVWDRLLFKACEKGATTAAWWIWKKGGHIHSLSSKESTPLHVAIRAGHLQTASALMDHMKANPFLKDSEGLTALDLLPDEESERQLENAQRKEYRILSKVLMRRKDLCDQRDLMQLILFHLVLALQHRCKSVKAGHKSHWKLVLKLLIDNLPEQVNPLSWIQDLLASLIDSLANSNDNTLDYTHICDYSVLIIFAQRLFILFDEQPEKQNVDLTVNHNTEILQKKAMRLCCEEHLPLFLHLLVNGAGVTVNAITDMEYNVTAMHHAARYNNRSALVYLINYGASEFSQDLYGNVPGHHALMHGHRDIFEVIPYSFPNSRGVTLKQLEQSFKHYMRLYRVPTYIDDLEPHERNDAKKVTHSHLKRLGKEWEDKGIARSVKEIHVDFTKGESLELMRSINELIERLLEEVALVEPLLQGEHKMLGSSADNVRLYGPDEFDANVVLKNISGHPHGGVRVSITSEKVDNEGRTAYISLSSDKAVIQHLLEESNLVDNFYEVIKECFPKCQITDKRLSVMSLGIKRTQVGVGLNLVWIGREFPLLHVGVDLVPTIEAPWPDQLPRPMLTSADLKTVYINSTGKGRWRFSFAQAENMIMKELTEEQRTVYLVCKIILARLKAEDWAPRVIKNQYRYFNSKFFNIPSPKGFSLKNSFFLELEEVQDAKLWTQEHRFERVVSVFRRMCVEVCDPTTKETTLDSGKMKAYFGGDFEGACAGFGAPEVVKFLESLENSDIWDKMD